MSTEILKKFNKIPSKKVLLISLAILILLIIIISFQIFFMVLKNDKIYNGVKVNNVSVSGYSRDSLFSKLDSEYNTKAQNLSIEFKAGSKSSIVNFSYDDVEVVYDIREAVDKAYSVGRMGNIFRRISDIIKFSSKGYDIPMQYTYDKLALQSFVDKLYDTSYVPVKESQLVLNDNKAEIAVGHHGESIDKVELTKKAEELIKKCEAGMVTADINIIQCKPMNADEYYNSIIRDAKDATFSVADNNLNVVPEEQGRNIDKSALVQIISELQNSEDTVKELPVQFVKPKVLKADLQGSLFKSEIGSFTTVFDTSNENNANRGENIRLAVQSINGKILAPGDTFSFNDVVGPRTAEGGYKEAHAYSAGQVVNEIGGGICQVSTTLYNAVLRADLQIAERINHMFTVGYVELGMDAAVSYGSADLKFVNSSPWPVKIEGVVTSDNQIIFKLLGTNVNPGKTVQFYSAPPTTIDTPVEYTDDPALPSGETDVIKEGAPGCSVDTYKIVKQDGNVVSEGLLSNSYYQPMPRVVRRGIG